MKSGALKIVDYWLDRSQTPSFFRHEQHAERSNRSKSKVARFGCGRAFVNEQQIRIQFGSKNDGLALSSVEFISEDLHGEG